MDIATIEKNMDLQTYDGPAMRVGDTVRVHVRITEGEKTRIQVFQGTVIAMKHSGPRATFTVRKVSYNVGVERIFPVHSPMLANIEVVSRHKVRRSKLYYLRERRGKAARLKEIRGALPNVPASKGKAKGKRKRRRG